VLSHDDVETISGDLEEMFHGVARRSGRLAAMLWHWRQVLSIVWTHVFSGSNETIDPQHRRGTMTAFRQDLFYAVRSLRKQPGFAATAVLMLAIGIGANVAIFSLVNAVLLKPLPFAEPGHLMIVHMSAPEFDNPGVTRRMIWSYPKYLLFRDNQQVFTSTAAFSSATWNITGTTSPERAIGEFVESTYFHTLGINPELGRTFSADETRAPGSTPLAVLGYGFWTRRFGGDRGIIGRDIGLNGIPHTIVGVLPPGFRGLTGQAEVWVPLTTLSADDLGEKWNHSTPWSRAESGHVGRIRAGGGHAPRRDGRKRIPDPRAGVAAGAHSRFHSTTIGPIRCCAVRCCCCSSRLRPCSCSCASTSRISRWRVPSRDSVRWRSAWRSAPAGCGSSGSS
jgi:hypothetical protein